MILREFIIMCNRVMLLKFLFLLIDLVMFWSEVIMNILYKF